MEKWLEKCIDNCRSRDEELESPNFKFCKIFYYFVFCLFFAAAAAVILGITLCEGKFLSQEQDSQPRNGSSIF